MGKLLNFKKFTERRRPRSSDVITALDLGSSKVTCVMARQTPHKKLDIIGFGQQASQGIKSGHIVDMEAAEVSILNAVHLAEQNTEEQVEDVYVNVFDSVSVRSQGRVPIGGHAVDTADVRRAIMLSERIPKGYEPIHTIPLGYQIDGRGGIQNPQGMFGEQLSVNVHRIYSAANNLRNLTTCLNRCHLRPRAFVSSSYAAGMATLLEDEMQLGAAVIDLGAGTTSVGIFAEGRLIHSCRIPIGGQHITNDISRVLSTPLSYGERLKILQGSAIISPADDRETIKIPQMGDSPDAPNHYISKSDLINIIRPRLEETFEMIKNWAAKESLDRFFKNRLVLTGGASQLPGLRNLATSVFGKQQVRLGRPLHAPGLIEGVTGPDLSGALGLLTCAFSKQVEPMAGSVFSDKNKTFGGRLGQWLRENL